MGNLPSLAVAFFSVGIIGSVIAQQSPLYRPTRTDRIRKFGMLGEIPDGEIQRPAGEIIAEFLKQDDREILALLVAVLRKKTLNEEQISQVLEAAKRETSNAKRIFIWQALFYSQSETAHQYLEQLFGHKSEEEGAILEFLQSIRFMRATEVPMLTRIYQTTPTELIRIEILNIALGVERQRFHDRDEEIRSPQADAARGSLLGWLLRHPASDADKERLLSLGLQRLMVAPTSREDVQSFLINEKSAKIRTTAYSIMFRYLGHEWLSFMLENEKDPVVQLTVLTELEKKLQERDERSALPPEYLVKSIRDGLGKQIPEATRQQLVKLLDITRRKAMENTIQQYHRQIENLSFLSEQDPGQLERSLKARAGGPDVDGTIKRLKTQYGELPDEDKFRANLTDVQAQYKKRLEEIVKVGQNNPETQP